MSMSPRLVSSHSSDDKRLFFRPSLDIDPVHVLEPRFCFLVVPTCTEQRESVCDLEKGMQELILWHILKG